MTANRQRALSAVLWDMDGVLADSGDAHFAAWRGLLAERGTAVSRRQFDDTFGMANDLIVAEWFGEALTSDERRALGLRKEERFRGLLAGNVRLLPGVTAWLERFQGWRWRQAVASSGEMANVAAVVAHLGIGNYFDALLSGAFLPRSKPDPTVFLHAAAALGSAPHECLVIEDGVPGVEAARRAGMLCIAVTTTHPAERLASADLVVESLDDLTPEMLNALCQSRG